MLVDPVATLQVGMRQLAHREHHLTKSAIDHIAVIVDVDEFIIGTNLLKLRVGGQQGPMVPQADIVDRRFVALDIRERQLLVGWKFAADDLVQAKGETGEFDIALDELALGGEFVGRNAEALEQHRIEVEADGVNEHEDAACDDQSSKSFVENLRDAKSGGRQGEKCQNA